MTPLDFQDKRFVVGIDLGTTNCAVSFVDLSVEADPSGTRSIKIFHVPQLTGAGEFSRLPVLPSFCYIPGDYDVSGEAIQHPWKKKEDKFAGAFARDHGSKIPSRLVSSAKSWLCHARADREAKILPWGSEGVAKISPVAATAQYLSHIKRAWNHTFKDEDLFLENQFVVLTVPASFDEAAREYTVTAAKMAGLGKGITLLEEPLAAFYAWLTNHEKDWQNYVKPDDLILVCDVGGGTTDFTLITLRESEGSPRFERVAVGDHLILGGDNIDLALANHIESGFKTDQTLTPDRWKTLCHKTREAKEKILGQGHTSVRITLKGEGRSLISGTLAGDLTKENLEAILTRGFFPEVASETVPRKPAAKAIAEFGLPYEQEPAITKHIGWFLEKHRDEIRSLLDKEPMPDLILFNGGSLKPELLQGRTRASIRRWFGSEDPQLPAVLDNPDLDLSVALGAAYYGLVKQGSGVRVGSGSPRSYYLGVATPEGIKTDSDQSVVCVVERGLDEGSLINLPKMRFEVLTNRPVSFDMFSSSYRSGDRAGDLVRVDDTLTPMTPMHTVIKFGKKGEKKNIPVTVEPRYTEMGTLSMWCNSSVSSHKWQLQFQLREQLTPVEAMEAQVLDDTLVKGACALIKTGFDQGGHGKKLASLVKQIEKTVGNKRKNWPLSLLRQMADTLIEHAGARELSPDHEVRWLNLCGFCLRPGFGDAFDEDRLRKIWKIYLSGPAFPKAKQNAMEWWIFLRRVAGGLNAGQQRQFFQDTAAYLPLGKAVKKRVPPQEMIEIWMAAANMERLLVKDKISLGRAVQSQLKSGKTPAQLFWSFSRIGARELLYGSVDRVVPPKEVFIWIKKLVKGKWKNSDPVTQAIAQMARKTGDRTRDLDPDMIKEVMAGLDSMGAKKEHAGIVQEQVGIRKEEAGKIFGESLPQGLVLKD